MRFVHIVFLSLLLSALCGASASAGITSLRVSVSGKTFTIPAFAQDGVLFASLDELSRGAGFPLYGSAASEKIEVRIGERRLKFTADNPFVIVIAQKDNTIAEVYQLPTEVRRTKVAFYLPMATALPLLSRVWGKSLLLDQEKAELIVDGAATPVARVTGSPDGAAAAPAASAPAQTVTRETAIPKKAVPVKADATRTSGDTAMNGKPAASVSTSAAADKNGGTALAPRQIVAETSSKFDVPRISVDSRKNGTLVRIHTRKTLKDYDSEMKDGLLVVSLPGASVDVNEVRQTPTDGEGIIAVEAEQLGGNARITFKLNESYTSDKMSQDVRTGDLLISLYKDMGTEKIRLDGRRGKQDGDRSKWKLDCIVIDAGHGGRDPGAIGVSGIKEKNVTLGIALKLGKLIEREMPGVKVVYTRKDDTFVPLDKRGQIANAAEGKLFISIHCNATEAKPSNAKGFEVYILRPGRTAEAIRIAEFENSVIKLEKDYEKRYAKLDDENFVLVNMAQSAYVKYSERFAEMLHEEVKGSRQITSKGVKQAGFYVLVGASMPGVLIESGFVSNRNEEQFLSTNAGQEHMARLFYNSIADYAKEYQKSLDE
jgi:N-acetylmuramoyl-L-alanine amidase